MLVSFNIPGPLREFTGQQSKVEIEVRSGASLVESVQALFLAYPGLRDRILTESGQLRQHVNIFVGKEDIRYVGGLSTTIPADAEISIVPAISGGTSVKIVRRELRSLTHEDLHEAGQRK